MAGVKNLLRSLHGKSRDDHFLSVFVTVTYCLGQFVEALPEIVWYLDEPVAVVAVRRPAADQHQQRHAERLLRDVAVGLAQGAGDGAQRVLVGSVDVVAVVLRQAAQVGELGQEGVEHVELVGGAAESALLAAAEAMLPGEDERATR